MGYSYQYLDTDRLVPLFKCTLCGHDFTRLGGVLIELCVGGQEVNVESRIDDHGFLEDTEDFAIEAGFHSATLCGGCREPLGDLEEVDEIQYA